MDQRVREKDEKTEQKRIEVPTDQARQATREGVGRHVLHISLVLVIVAFIILYLVFFA